MKDHFKKVLFVGPHYGLRGGMASVLMVYSKNIVPFHFLSTYYKKNPLLSLLYFAKAVVKFLWILISNREIRLIHIHTASRGSFTRKSVIVLLSKALGKKVVLHIHGGEFKTYFNNAGILKGYIRYILNTADELICLSDEWKVYFDSLTTKQKSIIVNNPVSIPVNVPLKTTTWPVSVLFLNHIDPKKGIFDLTSFFKENKSWLEGSFKLVIAGAGESEKLLQYISDNQLSGLIEYKGWVSGKDKDDLIEASDVFILPSYNEGLPVSILEAMAYSKAVIATNVGGIPRIVRPGENGWLTAPADKVALAEIFKEIKEDKEILARYGQHSFEIAGDYAPAKVNEKLSSIYDGLLTPQKG